MEVGWREEWDEPPIVCVTDEMGVIPAGVVVAATAAAATVRGGVFACDGRGNALLCSDMAGVVGTGMAAA